MSKKNTPRTDVDVVHFPSWGDQKIFGDASEAVAYATFLYNKNTEMLRQHFEQFLMGKADGKLKQAGYPYVAVDIRHYPANVDPKLAYGFVRRKGFYGTTLTRPDIFEAYWIEQLDMLIENHGCKIEVGTSKTPIPIHFAFGSSDRHFTEQLTPELAQHIHNYFSVPNLAKIDDNIANGVFYQRSDKPGPLSLFGAERVDLSLQRLKHYTGTSADHFQNYIVFTNYPFYVDEFIKYAMSSLSASSTSPHLGYHEFVEPGDIGHVYDRSSTSIRSTPGKKPINIQMPAYHLKRPDKNGITLINIGVGPSNAKTITDHVAVLRPHCWLMLGHCAGLRRSQRLGDYVLAHGYVREDHVLNDDLPPWVPIPPLAEIQLALEKAVAEITGVYGYDVKNVMRTGTVVTTDNRNWELQDYSQAAHRYSLARAIAVDMESGTIAANGLRMRVPYGTLLCVSDKPVHGQLKLPGMADQFYRQQVNQHLEIGIRCLQILHDHGADKLHSRKLRMLDDPAFR